MSSPPPSTPPPATVSQETKLSSETKGRRSRRASLKRYVTHCDEELETKLATHGSQHSDVLDLKLKKARALASMRDPSVGPEALELCDDVLAARQLQLAAAQATKAAMLHAYRPDDLAARSQALELYRVALPALERGKGPGDKEVLRAKRQLARLLRTRADISDEEAGGAMQAALAAAAAVDELAEALRLYEDVLFAVQRVHGGTSLETSAAKADVARTLLVFGDRSSLQRAQLLYEEVLDVERREYGEDHAEVAATKHNLAAVLQAMGDTQSVEASLRLLDEVIAVEERAFGAEDPEVLETRATKAAVQEQLSRTVSMHEGMQSPIPPQQHKGRRSSGGLLAATPDATGTRDGSRASSFHSYDGHLAAD